MPKRHQMLIYDLFAVIGIRMLWRWRKPAHGEDGELFAVLCIPAGIALGSKSEAVTGRFVYLGLNLSPVHVSPNSWKIY